MSTQNFVLTDLGRPESAGAASLLGTSFLTSMTSGLVGCSEMGCQTKRDQYFSYLQTCLQCENIWIK